MTAKDRTEVRDIFHSTIIGYHAKVDAQNAVTNASLGDIKDHLKTLNGKVYEHERIITANIPHNVSHCVQAETIQAIRDSMVTSKAVKKAIFAGISTAGVIFSIIFILYKLITKQP